MKKKVIISLVAFSCLFILVYAQVKPEGKVKEIVQETVVKESGNRIVEIAVSKDKEYEQKMMPMDCKSCHACDYPTKNDPCLIACPRASLITVYHSPNEGPAIVHMNDVKGDYGEVSFSHKIHAEMSSFSIGCDGCHHYNTTGPVVKCKTCHSETRKRDDISIPDLEAAYHRQCLNCHRQWNRSTDCLECHLENHQDKEKIKQEKISKYSNYTHPPLTEPKKIIYKTKQKGGKFVTFYHNEHTQLYGISCKSCHKNDNCISCHDIKNAEYSGDDTKQKKTHKSFEDHHQPCISCHVKDVCAKCHADKPMDEFNHSVKTGFNTAKNHSKLSCNKCHFGDSFKGLNKNCMSCHKEFTDGKFNHSKTGVKLDDIHKDLSCADCHKNYRFDAAPSCADCHDGFKFPINIPGIIIKK